MINYQLMNAFYGGSFKNEVQLLIFLTDFIQMAIYFFILLFIFINVSLKVDLYHFNFH